MVSWARLFLTQAGLGVTKHTKDKDVKFRCVIQLLTCSPTADFPEGTATARSRRGGFSSLARGARDVLGSRLRLSAVTLTMYSMASLVCS